MRSVEKIISGGQTGADRGGLDAAIALGIPHGGWCPYGRICEDGEIPERYLLQQTNSAEYIARTRRNVQDSDATVIFVRRMTPGSQATIDVCKQLERPFLIVSIPRDTIGGLQKLTGEPVARLSAWLAKIKPKTLNVAGSRESKAPGIAGAVEQILRSALQEPDA